MFFCSSKPLPSPQVICVHDVTSIYRVPLLLEDQGVVGYLSSRLNMPIETKSRTMLTKWKEMSDRWAVRGSGGVWVAVLQRVGRCTHADADGVVAGPTDCWSSAP